MAMADSPPGSVPPAVVPEDTALTRSAGDLRVAVGRIVRRLRQQWGDGELTAAEMSMLKRLEQDGPCGQAALAEAEQVTPPVVCAAVAALQQRGLVDREPDPNDGRRVVVSLA